MNHLEIFLKYDRKMTSVLSPYSPPSSFCLQRSFSFSRDPVPSPSSKYRHPSTPKNLYTIRKRKKTNPKPHLPQVHMCVYAPHVRAFVKRWFANVHHMDVNVYMYMYQIVVEKSLSWIPGQCAHALLLFIKLSCCGPIWTFLRHATTGVHIVSEPDPPPHARVWFQD